MSRFSEIKEKDFLISYYRFTSRLRTRLIRQLCKQYSQANTIDEKRYCLILSLEQLSLLYETLEGVFVAFKKRRNKPFLDTMANTKSGIQEITSWLNDKTTEEALEEVGYKIERFDPKTQDVIKEKLSIIIGFWQKKRVARIIKELIIPAFNKTKHKLMVYEKDGAITFAFEDIKNEQVTKHLEEMGLKQNSRSQLPKNINPLAEIAEWFENALRELIALRLYELGIKPEELT